MIGSGNTMADSGQVTLDMDNDVIQRGVSQSWLPGELRPSFKTYKPGGKRPTIGQLTANEQRDRSGSLVRKQSTFIGRMVGMEGPVKFGVFKGVITPCLLNIWGVIMFLRTGWMVGVAGIPMAVLIIVACSLVTTLTTLSLSATCTNGDVGGGGAYFFISRALGPEFGGAVGIMFYLANAVVHAIYVIGFAEGVVDIIKQFNGDYFTGDLTFDVRIVGCATAVLIILMTKIGIEGILFFQVFLLAILVASIITFFVSIFLASDTDIGFTGFSLDTLNENMSPSWGNENFFTVFAIFFPAVTGITAGANLSGDLKDPAKAIPNGTLFSIGLSSSVYILIAIFMGWTLKKTAADGGLIGDFLIMIHMAKGGAVVLYLGLLAATLSSAIASMLGAPRVLQAFAEDGIVPFLRFFAKMTANEPLRGYAITFVIAFPLVLMADINFVSPIVTNFFLISYALINYSCFAQSLSRAPGWRPSFRYFNTWTALAGTVLCMVVMFLIDIENNCLLALATCLIGAALYKYVEHIKPKANWGDAQAARAYIETHQALLKLNSVKTHVKNYRPQYLVLTGDATQRPHLLAVADILKKGKGVTVFGHVLPGDLDPVGKIAGTNLRAVNPAGTISSEQFSDARLKLFTEVAKSSTKGFTQVFCSADFCVGALSMMQLAGLGGLRPNTIVMGYQAPRLDNETDDPPHVDAEEYVRTIRKSFNFMFNVVIAKGFKTFDFSKKRNNGTIDIWHKKWRGCRLRMMVLSDKQNMTKKVERTKTLLHKLRFPVQVVPVTATQAMPTPENVEAFNQLSIGPKTLSASKFKRPTNLRDIFTIDEGSQNEEDAAAPGEESKAAPTPGTATGVTGTPTQEDIRRVAEERRVNQRLVLLGEYISACSGESDLTIVSLPVPAINVEPQVYLARLHMMSKGVSPMLMVRGNSESVLTFRM